MLNDSKFYMWRTLFALVHADNIVTKEELEFIKSALKDLDLSEEQKTTLETDVVVPKDPIEMFRGISNIIDQKEFFNFAYQLVLIDGDYDSREYEVIQRLQEEHDKSLGKDLASEEIDLVFAKPAKGEKREFQETMNKFKDYF